ncbi:LD-carboxypeptidase [bacterium]|nr:LD-carboxypeptidase [bacterium]
MKSWLKYGDKVGVISPASGFNKDDFMKGLSLLESLGLKPVYDENIFNGKIGKLNGSDDFRMKDLLKHIDDSDISVIFCARGGYGSIKTLENIDDSIWRDFNKLIVGFSDITVFHSLLNKNSIKTLHAPMVASFSKNLETFNILFDALFGKTKIFEYNLKSFDSKNDNLDISGVLVGGNLAVLSSIIGTKFMLDIDDSKILFLEDISEPQYKIDRMLMQLKHSGVNPKAIILGQFTDSATIEEILETVSSIYPTKPLYYNLSVGHINYNLPLFLGVDVKINSSKLIISLEDNVF